MSARPRSATGSLSIAGLGGWFLGASVCLGVAGVALAMDPWSFNPFGPVKLACTLGAAALGCFGVALSATARLRIGQVSVEPSARFISIVLGLAVISLLTAVDRRAAILGRYPGYIGLVALACWVALTATAAGIDPQKLRSIAGRSLTIAVVVSGLYAITQRAGADPMIYRAGIDLDRVRSTLGNASDLAAFLAVALPAVADRVVRDRGAWRGAAGVAAVLAAVSLAWTGSRGGMLAAGVGLGVWLVLSRRGKPPGRAGPGSRLRRPSWSCLQWVCCLRPHRSSAWLARRRRPRRSLAALPYGARRSR